MSQRIRIKLQSYDHNLVDKSAEKIVKTARNTVKIFLCVGKGIGPVTTAPVLRTVFTIFSADLSTRLWS